MSHFIQDDLAAIQTQIGLFVFVKGGDNNVTSSFTNRRLSQWSFLGKFKHTHDALLWGAVTALSEVSGGGWKIHSHKNKTFKGIAGIEKAWFKRWKKAINNPIDRNNLDFDDYHLDMNIYSVTSAIQGLRALGEVFDAALREKGHRMSNEDQVPIGCGIATLYKIDYSPDVPFHPTKGQIERVQSRVDSILGDGIIPASTATDEHIEFLEKWAGIGCKNVILVPEFYGIASRVMGYFGIFRVFEQKEAVMIPMTEALFVAYFEGIKTFLQRSNYWAVSNFVGDYITEPEQAPLYKLFENFPKEVAAAAARTKLFDAFADGVTKVPFLSEIQSSFRRDVDVKEAEKQKRVQQIRIDAPAQFSRLWNDIEKFAWYKNTSQVLPGHITRLDQVYALLPQAAREASFYPSAAEGVNDAGVAPLGQFYELPEHYRRQRKGNLSAIRKAARHLISRYGDFIKPQGLENLSKLR